MNGVTNIKMYTPNLITFHNYKTFEDDFNAVGMFPVQWHCIIPSAIIRFAWRSQSVFKMKLDDTRYTKRKTNRWNENPHKACLFLPDNKFLRLLQYRQMVRCFYARLRLAVHNKKCNNESDPIEIILLAFHAFDRWIFHIAPSKINCYMHVFCTNTSYKSGLE